MGWACIFFLAVGALVQAQSFEVASVKPVQVPGGDPGPPFHADHGRFVFTTTVFEFIVRAYGIRGCDLAGSRDFCNLVSGGPEWLKKDKFEINAKSPEGTPDYTIMQFIHGQVPQLQPLLQALLADRFQLKVHRETKQLPVYELTVAKNGPKATLKKTSGGMERLFFGGSENIHLTVVNHSIQDLTDAVTSMMDRPVLDRTGLTGKFDFTLDYEKNPDARGIFSTVGPAVLTAFPEQLGLKMESAKAPVEVLVIDHVERPSAN